MKALLLKLVTGRLARKLLRASLRGFSKRSENKVDDFIVQAIEHLLDGKEDAAIRLLETFIGNWKNNKTKDI